MKNEKHLLTDKELDMVAGGAQKNFIAAVGDDGAPYYVEESSYKKAKFTPDGRIMISASKGLEAISRDTWAIFSSAAQKSGVIWTIIKDFKK